MTPVSAATALGRLLVVDDDHAILQLIDRLSRTAGFSAHCCDSGEGALASLADLNPDAALVDLRMPGLDGLEVLRVIRAEVPGCQVILMTGDASIETAVEAVKAGALDYLSKPLDLVRLHQVLASVREEIQRREQFLRDDCNIAAHAEFHGLTGRSPGMQLLFDNIRRLAPHARTVLITGETGTGKELVARAFHTLGPKRQGRLVTINCAAVVDTLFESELFGHVRGAFTGASESKAGLFEHAHDGTLFLDEAGELPLPLQSKLLRAIEYGEVQRVGSLDTRRVDVRVIAATNRDLQVDIPERFRADLFYRLSVVEVHVPPLRERREDIPYLTAVFLHECAKRLDRQIGGVSPSAERLLLEAEWPGNVRQLRNVIERACIRSTGRMLSELDLAQAMPPRRPVPVGPVVRDPGPGRHLVDPTRESIEEALRESAGNKAAAARRLGLSRQSLYRWLDRLKIDVGD